MLTKQHVDRQLKDIKARRVSDGKVFTRMSGG